MCKVFDCFWDPFLAKNYWNKPENQDEDALGKIEQQQDL